MRPSRVLTFAVYEAKRAVARKKVLALVALTLLVAVAPYYLLDVVHTALITPQLRPYMWVVGVFLPQAFFIQFTALLIAAGSMSEEYESGTAEVLLSKPVSREEYFAGKYIGGYALLVGILLLDATLTLTASTFVYGSQGGLGILPMVIAAQVFAASLFYSVAFMFGELMRRSSLSYIVAASFFFISLIIGVILDVFYELTGSGIYVTVNKFLPTSPVDSLALLLAEPRFPSAVSAIFRLGLGFTTPVETSAPASALLIAAYAFTAVVVALSYFLQADVSKRVT